MLASALPLLLNANIVLLSFIIVLNSFKCMYIYSYQACKAKLSHSEDEYNTLFNLLPFLILAEDYSAT